MKSKLSSRTLTALALFALLSCRSKGNEDKADAVQPVPNPLSSPVATGLGTTINGLPSNPSAASDLHLTIVGSQVLAYQYVLVHGESSCADVTYSALQEAAAPIDESLASDGPKTLCLIAVSKNEKGVEKASPFFYSWVKDSEAPAVAFMLPEGIGPRAQEGSTFDFSLRAIDQATPVLLPELSFSDGSHCLNANGNAFDASCPTYLKTEGDNSGIFHYAVNKSLFQANGAYQIQARVRDAASNEQTQGISVDFVWDTTPPGTVSSVTATAGAQQVSLGWTAVGSSHHYLVLRRDSSAVNINPSVLTDAAPGTHLGGGNFIACNTAQTSCVDSNLDAFTTYFYQVFALDAAGNPSNDGPRASALTQAKPGFLGLTRMYLSAPNKTISAEWQPFAPAGTSAATIAYDLFRADQPAEQDFSSPIATVVGSDTLSYTENSSSINLYYVARQRTDSDENNREIRLKMSPGTHHKLAANGRFSGQDPLAQAYLRSAWAVAFDPFGNVVFGGAPGTVDVVCQETSRAHYCKGRTIGKLYTIAGSDGADDGPDDSLASQTPMGEIFSIAFDSSGNMFLADANHARIRVVCYAPEVSGFCNGRSLGYVYHLAGTGSSAVDGVDDAVAKTTGIGLPYGIAVDNSGNVYVADNNYRKIRVICAQSDGPCSGRVVGNIYNLVGTGVAGDAADNTPALAANIGNTGSLALDRLGNVYFSDLTTPRIRAYCQNVTATQQFCAGKTAGNLYQLTGTGAAGDGGHNVLATAAQIATVNGIAVSQAGNVFIADNSAAGNRIRAICMNNSADASCLGRTVGNTYRVAGTGASTDGANNSLALAVSLGSPRGIASDSFGNFITADPTNRRIRLFCNQASAGSICDGKLPDYHYHLVGAGASSAGWNLNAMLTPMGLPQGLAEDSHGNIYTADATNFVIRVICYNTSFAGFCFNKTVGYTYIIAGVGATGNAADNSLAVASNIGVITGLEVDAQGNVFAADSTNRTIRLICGVQLGVCLNKSQGFMYRYIGTTTALDTPDNAVAVSSGLGIPADLSFDSDGNLWIADSQFFRIRLYCFQAVGTCAGKTAGNIYRMAGTGVTGNSADGVNFATAALGTLTSLDVDPWNNVVIGDSSNFFVRVLCTNGSGGYCQGKAGPTGKIYRALGTGVTGDALSGTAANTSAISAMNAVQTDFKGNIYLAETTNRRIRVLCVDNSATYCKGLNTGFSYRMLGSGVAGDASSNTAGNTARIDSPSRDSLLFTSQTKDLIYVGGGTPANHGVVRIFLGF